MIRLPHAAFAGRMTLIAMKNETRPPFLIKSARKLHQKSPQLYEFCALFGFFLAYIAIFFVIGPLFLFLLVTIVVLLVESVKTALHQQEVAAPVPIFAALLFPICLGFLVGIYGNLFRKRKFGYQQRLSPEKAPRLFKVVSEIAARIGTPEPREISLDEGHDVELVFRPRLGVFGFSQNCLVIGTGLLESTSTQQFRALLAAALAKHSPRLGRKAVWISEIRERWAHLYDHETSLSAMKSKIDRIPHVLFLWLLDGIFLNLFLWSVPASQKTIADSLAFAAAVTGHDFAVAALLRSEFSTLAVRNDFWNSIFRQANFSPEPDSAAFEKRAQFLRGAFSSRTVLDWLLTIPPPVKLTGDPVPSPLTRLRYLGHIIQNPEDVLALAVHTSATRELNETASQTLLGDFAEEFRAVACARWRSEALKSWQRHFARYQELQKKNLEVQKKFEARQIGAEEIWRHIVAASYFVPLEESEIWAERVLELDPQHAYANVLVGKRRLERNDPSGLHFLDTALQREPACTFGACEAAIEFLEKSDSPEQSKIYLEKVSAYQSRREKLIEFRNEHPSLESSSAHLLTSEELEKFMEGLRPFRHALLEVYLFLQQWGDTTEENRLVMGVVVDRGFLEPLNVRLYAVHRALTMNGAVKNGAYLVVATSGETIHRPVWRLVKGACVYRKAGFKGGVKPVPYVPPAFEQFPSEQS